MTPVSRNPRKAVFLDRDGVLNRAIVRDGRPFPPANLQELEIFEDLAVPLQALREAGYLTIVATNQPDVGRGTQNQAIVEAINCAIAAKLPVDDFRVCYHGGSESCPCRKPKPGMLLEASAKWGIDLLQSWMIGDRWRDVQAGRAAGCRTIFVDYGYDEPGAEADHVVDSPLAAVQTVLKMRLL